ncbi:MAG TPA: PKD domain-containing protein, partial [Chitinophagales bacterium]|nr:PKD domain-containing protein [Chitinophagales bacterium]
DGNGCTNTANSSVTLHPLPVVDAGPDQTFCEQNIPVQLTGTPANGTWSGTGVSATGSFNPLTAGVGSHTLTYSFTDGNSCTGSDDAVMTVIVPTLAHAGNDFPLCVNASPVDLNVRNNPAPAGGTWSGNGVANNFFTAANAVIGQNTLIYSIGTGTCLSRDTVIATVNPLPAITVNSPSVCAGNSVTLTANGGITYVWSPATGLSATTGTSVIATPASSITYTVTGTDGNGCTNTANSSVTLHPLPVVDAGPDQTFCNTNTPVSFTGNPANGIWSGTGITSAGIFNPSQAGVGVWPLTYSLTDANNCTNHDTTHATVADPQLADAGPDVAICVTGSAVDLTTIGATPAGGIWSGTGVIANVFYPITAGVGQHALTYSYGTGTCQTSDAASAIVNPQPVLSVNSPEICFRDTAVLTVFGADNYVWNPMNELSVIGGSTALAFPAATTAYMIIGTLAATGCSDTIISTVTVHPLPAVDAGPDQTVCNQNFSTQLNGTPSGGTWSGSFITPSGLFTPGGNPADTGSYTVIYTFTDTNSCANSDHAVVKVIEPVFAAAGPDRSFCVDDAPAALTGFSPASGGIWSGNGIENPSTGLFNPSIAGAGSTKLFYAYGSGTCATRDSVIITVHPIPTPAATFNITCIGDTTFFTDISTANAGTLTSWNWNFGDGTTSSLQNPSHIYSNGNFSVTFGVENSFGCDDEVNLSVVVHPLPTVAFTHDSMICPDSALQIYLTAADALNYYWDFGDGTTGTGINPTHSYSNVGVYQIKLVAETQFGCTDSATSRVRVPEPPNAFFTFNPKEGCAPLDVSFYPLLPPDWTGLRYMWIFGNGDTTFNPIPPDHIIYPAGANGADTSYVVEFYVFSHTCQNFGKHADTVKVLNTPPAVVTADFTPGCGKTEVTFTNSTGTVFDSLFIDYGDGTAEIIPAADVYFNHTFFNAGSSDVTYTVNYYATGAACSSVPGRIPVTVYPNTVKPGIRLAPNDACVGGEFTLTNASSGGAYYFYDLGTGSVFPNSNSSDVIRFSFADTGTYMIRQYVYSADSCSFGKDSAVVHVRPLPLSDFQYDVPSPDCDGAEVVFTGSASGSIKNIWNFGDNTVAAEADSPRHIFTSPGTYEVTLTAENEFGCKASISKPVTVDFLKKGLYVPNAFSPEFGDEKVREFKPAGQCLEYYHLHIYNTWGELLWETYELTPDGQPAKGWDGRHIKTGLLLPQDVYVWKIEATFMNSSVWRGKEYDDRVRRIGSVTLLR